MGRPTVPAGADDGTTAELRVHDDCPGVPEDLRPRVFERFTHGERRRAEGAPGGTGTGLGLSIVAAVTEAHGGGVTLDSVPGATSFAVRLPARSAASDRRAGAHR